MTDKYYLGVDFGTAKVGIALADPETRVALALTTFRNDAFLIQKIRSLVKQEHIGTIVIGISSHIHFKGGSFRSKEFGDTLMKELGREVVIAYQEEMFTTKMAQDNLIERGTHRVSGQDDAESARIILTDWLDRQKSV